MGRWLGIDHGTKRIGLSVGDTEKRIASPVKAIPAQPYKQAIGDILQVAREYQVEGIVVGWPLNMDDTEGAQGKLARELASQLADSGCDVRLWDERLSSFATDKLLAGKFTRKKKRARHDAVAASQILQDFLSSDGPSCAPRPTET